VTGLGKGFAPSVSAASAALGQAVPLRQTAHPPGLEGTKFSLDEMGKAIREGRNDPRIRAWAGTCIARAEALAAARQLAKDAWVESDKVQGGHCAQAKSKTGGELGKATKTSLAGAFQELRAKLLNQAGLKSDSGALKTNQSQCQAILDEIRRVTYYVQDPVGTELIAKPHVTLCLDDHGLCLPSADCDDRTVCLGSATMSIGIDTRVVAASYGTPQATHVYAAIIDEKGNWLRVDPSHASWPVGQVNPAMREWWVDPLTGSIANDSNMTVKTTLGKEPEHGDFIGVGAVPMAHAFSPLAHGASYVPVGLENGYPCKPDGTECGDEGGTVEFQVECSCAVAPTPIPTPTPAPPAPSPAPTSSSLGELFPE
jgi:hypothetical protein